MANMSPKAAEVAKLNEGIKPEAKPEVKQEAKPEVKQDASLPNHFFRDNLHLFYSKSNLFRMNGIDNRVEDSFHNKIDNFRKDEKSERNEIGRMIDLLKELFKRPDESYGGGLTLDQLKQKIRDKVRRINPRF